MLQGNISSAFGGTVSEEEERNKSFVTKFCREVEGKEEGEGEGREGEGEKEGDEDLDDDLTQVLYFMYYLNTEDTE